MKTVEERAIEIAVLLEDGKGQDVCVIDISGLNSWTDYFVISTVASSVQQDGLLKQIKDYIKNNDMELCVPNRKSPDGCDWQLVDAGDIVIHLMSENARQFYELEKLWYLGRKIELHK